MVSIGSSFLFSLLTVLATPGMCLLPASVFARSEFAGKTLLEGLLLTPALVPLMTFAMGLHFLFIKFSLADTLVGVVLILATFSYPNMFRALVAGFQTMGEEYQICARHLRAGRLRTLFTVELPLLLPAIIAGGSVVFLVVFSEYFLVFLIGGGSVPSFTGYLFPLLNSSNSALALMLTLIFLFLPIILFSDSGHDSGKGLTEKRYNHTLIADPGGGNMQSGIGQRCETVYSVDHSLTLSIKGNRIIFIKCDLKEGIFHWAGCWRRCASNALCSVLTAS